MLDRDDTGLGVGIERRAGAPPPFPPPRAGEGQEGVARPDAPALALHLVLARLDDEAKEIVGVGKAAQLVKADRLVGARPGDEL